MNIEVLFQAKQGLIDAVGYYELQQEGLGLRLWEEERTFSAGHAKSECRIPISRVRF